jgi:hypothetical protein
MIAAILRNQAIDGTVVCAGRLVDDATSHPIPAGWARCLARHRVVRPTDAANHFRRQLGRAGRANESQAGSKAGSVEQSTMFGAQRAGNTRPCLAER